MVEYKVCVYDMWATGDRVLIDRSEACPTQADVDQQKIQLEEKFKKRINVDFTIVNSTDHPQHFWKEVV